MSMTQLIRIAICEDNTADATHLKQLLAQSGFETQIEAFTSGEEFIEHMQPFIYDVIFLDICMKEINGITLAEHIRKQDSHTQLVFTTSNNEYALVGYRVQALQYLIKPVKSEDINQVLQQVRKQKEDVRYIPFVSEGKRIDVACQRIMYIEIYGKNTMIHTTDGPICVHLSIDVMSQLLPSSFVRTHRSYIVNFNYVKKLEEDFIMENGAKIYIRKKGAEEIKQKWHDFLIESTRGDSHDI
ncbi:LytTR family two component transcriptional regulator [Breznakia blatticola]|uniref:LytTR family two component transcriptional regulator n=1 Tax=Breznakia blatticola TaxID=1754012 RepID=A0A4V3G6C4_9FIRM|nr:LytTR family DNA-binding domain-containing protein [Breznakia blatticola]TDW14734.1 LytTR family two component transcriptional regulator [Breznakia blatticola]